MIFQDHLADGLLLILINSLAKNCQPVLVVSELGFQFLGDLTDVLFSGLFVVGEYGNFHRFGRNDLLDGLEELLGNCTALVGVFCLTALSYDGIDEFDDLLVYFVSLENSLDHFCFRNLFCSCLDHDNFFTGGSNGQLQIGNILLSQGRVYDEFAVNHTDLGSGAGTIERNIGNAGSDGGTQHSDYFRVALGIYGHNQVIEGYVVAVVLRKQRTHRTVDDTGSQDCMLAGFSLSLVEAAGNLSYGVHLLLVLYAQGEEIDTLTGFVGCSGGAQNGGVAKVHESCTVSLFCNSADIYAQRSSGEFHGKRLIHMFFSFSGSYPSETTEKKIFPEKSAFQWSRRLLLPHLFTLQKQGRKKSVPFCC